MHTLKTTHMKKVIIFPFSALALAGYVLLLVLVALAEVVAWSSRHRFHRGMVAYIVRVEARGVAYLLRNNYRRLFV